MTSQDVLKTMLLGTARAVAAPAPEHGSGDLTPFFRGESSEKALWNAAVAASMQSYAGARPTRSNFMASEPCPHEKAPFLPPAAALRGVQLAAKEQTLWLEWLRLAAQAGFVAPPEILPELLEAARAARSLRPLVLPLLGERGRWLAAQNPDWRTVAAPRGDDDQATWETGAFPARLEALRATREADPTLARAWVEAVWTQEAAAARGQLLEVFERNLGGEDEAFLERALDDKSKDVRLLAAQLLSRLPASAYAARMWERARQFVSWETKGHLMWKTGSIHIDLPEAWDKSWAHDGLFELQSTYARNKVGDKAFWVSQLLARVPPSRWESEWNVGAEAIQKGIEGDWKEMLREAFFQAQLRCGDFRWMLLWNRSEGLPAQVKMHPHHLPARVWEDILDPLGDTQIKDAINHYDQSIMTAFRTLPNWNDRMSRLYLEAVREHTHSLLKKPEEMTASSTFHTHTATREAATKLSLTVLNQAAQGWPETHPNWHLIEPALRPFLNTVHTRLDIRRELGIS